MTERRSWALHDEKLKKLVAQGLSNEVIATRLGRTLGSVADRKISLGLTKSRPAMIALRAERDALQAELSALRARVPGVTEAMVTVASRTFDESHCLGLYDKMRDAVIVAFEHAAPAPEPRNTPVRTFADGIEAALKAVTSVSLGGKLNYSSAYREGKSDGIAVGLREAESAIRALAKSDKEGTP